MRATLKRAIKTEEHKLELKKDRLPELELELDLSLKALLVAQVVHLKLNKGNAAGPASGEALQ